MLAFSSAGNDLVDSRGAMSRCIEEALGTQASECSLLIVYSTMGHNFSALLAQARHLCPQARIVGSTCAGVIDRRGPNESMRALAIMAVRGPADEFSVAMTERPQTGSFEAGARLGRRIGAEKAVARHVLVHASVLDFQPIQEFVAGIESTLPNVSIFGGLSIDNMKFAGNYQFFDEEIVERGSVAVGFGDPSLDLICGATHGFTPFGDPFAITSSDGNIVHELNKKPAWKALTERVGLPETATMSEVGTLAVLATREFDAPPREYDSPYVVRGGPIRTEEGDLVLNAACPPQMHLQLLRRDESQIFDGVERLVRRLRKECSRKEVAAVFHADCAARGKAMFDRIAKEELVGLMLNSLASDGRPPWLGMYGGGELTPLDGRNTIVAYTTSLYALVRHAAPQGLGS